jgi:hypothetical protein
MSERGVFAVDRGIWDHELVTGDDPFSRREALLWLFSEAAWKSRSVRISGKSVELKRGQLAHSIRFIAKAWNWSKSRVDRFLDELKHEAIIGTETVHGQTVITVCKYNEYQRVALPDRDNSGTEVGTKSGTAAGQQRDKLENIKTIKIKDAAPSGAHEPLRETDESRYFRRCVDVLGETGRSLGAKLLKAKDRNYGLAAAALELASTKQDPREYIGAIIRGRGNSPEDLRARGEAW